MTLSVREKAEIKMVRFLLYVGGFFALFFLFSVFLCRLSWNLPLVLNCGELQCQDTGSGALVGFVVVIGSLIVGGVVSLLVTVEVYSRWEVNRNRTQKNAEGTESLPYEDKM
jgi:hypothetical protein